MPKSNKYNNAYGLSNPLQNIFPDPVVAQRAPTASDLGYRIGQIWVDVPTGQIYGLASIVAGSATWSVLGPGSSDVDTLTGDTGGALSPTGGNINIIGGDLVTVDGSGSTLTINATSGGYPITPYVVGSSGEAGYTTIQSALDAIGAGGSGNVWVQPGTYTEDLVFPNNSNIGIVGTSDEATGPTVVGVHTPPAAGNVVFWRVALTSSSDIFSSAAAGTANILIAHNIMTLDGYLFNLPNWTSSGSFTTYAIGDFASTSDGIVNNTGGASVFLYQSGLGVNTTNPGTISGFAQIQLMDIDCPLTIQGSNSEIKIETCNFFQPLTLSGSCGGFGMNTRIASGASAAITYSTSGDWELSNFSLNSSNNPCIAGAGAGTLTVNNLNFTDNAVISSSLTLAGGDTRSATFTTLDQAAGLTISGNDIDADGSDANISITVTPKGTGDFIVDLGDIQNTSGDIIATHSSAGADVTLEATNSDNTNSASRAGVELAVGGTSAGDPYANFLISGGQTFTMGIDNSTANDDFVISDSAALGTTNRISIDGSSGIVTAVSGFTSTGTTAILDSVNANTSINTGTSTGTVSIGNSAAGAITVDTAAGISLDAATASNFTVTGAGADLTLSSVGGSVAVSSTEDAASAISLTANGGTSETVVITASQGTGAASIGLTSTAGGITASAGLATTDAINLTASAGGVDIDGALEVNITSSEAAVADAVTISASAADGGITLDAGATPGVTFTNGTQSHQMLVGSGSPNGSVTASQGSLYVDVAGSTSTTILFANTDGGTTWVGVGA